MNFFCPGSRYTNNQVLAYHQHWWLYSAQICPCSWRRRFPKPARATETWKFTHDWSSGKKSSKTSKSLGFLCFVFGGCAWLCSEKAQSQPQVGRTFLCNQLFGEVNHFVSMVPYTSTYSISKDHKHRVYLPLKHFCIVFILEPPWALWLPNDIGGSIAAHLSMSKSETKTIGFISLPRVLKWFQFPLAPKPPFARVLPLRKGDPHKRPMPNLNQSRLAEPRTENQGH